MREGRHRLVQLGVLVAGRADGPFSPGRTDDTSDSARPTLSVYESRCACFFSPALTAVSTRMTG